MDCLCVKVFYYENSALWLEYMSVKMLTTFVQISDDTEQPPTSEAAGCIVDGITKAHAISV